MAVVTHYDTLKVSRTAPVEVIRAVYKALAQKYHPDRNLNNPEAVLMMQLINIAYNTLTDARKRAEHDAWIAQQEPKKPAAAAPAAPTEAQIKNEKILKEVSAWEAFAAKEVKEAEAFREKANKAAQQAAAAGRNEKTKWDAYAKQAAADATAAEAKAVNTRKYANEKIAALGVRPAAPPPAEKKITTHYDTLFVARNASVEVIKAAHKTLALKYQPTEGGTTAEAAQMLQILNDAYKILTDAAKRAEHDAWIAKQEPQKKEDPAAAGPRKTTAREAEFQAQADKLAKDAGALKAWAEQADVQAKEAEAKAAKAGKDAAAKAKDKDAAAWATFAAKEAANAKEMRDRANKAAEKAKAEQERAEEAARLAAMEKQRAVREAAEKAAEDEKNRALWEKNK
ncbi:MAG: J domain-containing protein [Alphaproteobacteria bacterium]|nr:MAG: J domain-containing protein [Alphaproteobacteria bacterium]